VFFLLAATAAAGQFDGQWAGDMKMPAGKKAEQEARVIPVSMTFTADGAVLKGTVKDTAGKKAQPLEIQNGKIEGDKIYFQTTQKTKRGDQTIRWEGTLQGGELKMSRQGRGRRSGTEFTLKRVS